MTGTFCARLSLISVPRPHDLLRSAVCRGSSFGMRLLHDSTKRFRCERIRKLLGQGITCYDLAGSVVSSIGELLPDHSSSKMFLRSSLLRPSEAECRVFQPYQQSDVSRKRLVNNGAHQSSFQLRPAFRQFFTITGHRPIRPSAIRARVRNHVPRRWPNLQGTRSRGNASSTFQPTKNRRNAKIVLDTGPLSLYPLYQYKFLIQLHQKKPPP
jgi:hypothetical protein